MNTNANIVVSRQYSLAFLASHPATKGIVKKHLEETFDEAQKVHASLRELFETNMGGGIPYKTIVALMNDLDKLTI
jgi:hypothetical protein